MPRVDCGLVKRGLTGLEEECGDAGLIRVDGEDCFLALIDGLGHGREAHNAAVVAADFILEDHHRNLIEMMTGLHSRLKGTRGAVATLCRLNIPGGELHYVGVGNITTRVFGAKNYSFVSRDGIIGYMMSSPKLRIEKLSPGDILILTSDGLKEHFDPDEFPGLLCGSAQEIAANMMANLGKANDDASCIVLRYVR
ncbi:MAG: SpoIIE family protein phosphatase [Deltaproteobacteria bacterium]|nr:SpoIIE family protein phosphatase [Deltaproteobacteria bacterium]